jgi:prepilin-type N-terminal cleavage/methylation domain-containing protein
MFMYLQKNKKGFTLIELMVVVAIIGILALLGLRVYSGQQDRAKAAIVKGNAGTIQTLIQSELADRATDTVDGDMVNIIKNSGIVNPFTNAKQQSNPEGTGAALEGLVKVVLAEGVFEIQAHGKDGVALYDPALTARR